MIEDLCDEIHGIMNVKTFSAGGESLQSVRISLNGQWVQLNKTEGTSYPASLSPNEARYLASKLRRLATLADQRRAKT